MRIIGGSYVERVREPHYNELFGSGLRAALVSAKFSGSELDTVVDEAHQKALLAIAGAYKVQVNLHNRPRPIVFTYDTPLSPPTIDGTSQDKAHISVNSEVPVLVFGMLDATSRINSSFVVYDPQRPRNPQRSDLNHIESEHLAIVANISEIKGLGESSSIPEAIEAIFKLGHIETIVLKRGPLGATVFTLDRSPVQIGPNKTQSVWPIGSGDVFSAVFTHFWAEKHYSPADAALQASLGTAHYCTSRNLDAASLGSSDSGVTQLAPRQDKVRVYLAGPFFSLSQRWMIELCLSALSHQGAEVFSPLHAVGCGGDEVAVKDIDGLKRSEVVFGLLDGSDAGTIFELGYASSLGKKVVGFAEHPDHDDYKMLRGLGISIYSDLTTAIYHTFWACMSSQ